MHAIRRTVVLVTLVTLALGGARAAAQTTATAGLDRLRRELTRVAAVAGGTVGATAIHLESGQRASVNGEQAFPMASTYKVPIAVQLLTLVDAGEVRLDRMVTLEPFDLHPGSGTLSYLFNKPGVSLSIRNLLELMLLISDNSATDVLLAIAGGHQAVTDRMRALGIDGIRVDRSTAELIANWRGLDELPPADERTLERLQDLMDAIPPETRLAARERFDVDPRDTATPDAMGELLRMIHQGRALEPDSTALLLDIMLRCQTGAARLKGLLPAETPVAHKTGSIGGTTNDVGIITLPDGAGHVAIAVFVKGSEEATARRERGIAEIARAAHDFFLFRESE